MKGYIFTATHTSIEGSTRTLYVGPNIFVAYAHVEHEVGDDPESWDGVAPNGDEACFYARSGEAREVCEVWCISWPFSP